MSRSLNLQGRTAVVTGAAGGIGRAIAASLAHRGCHLALADIDAAALAQTAAQLAALSVRVSQHPIDVADREAVAALPTQVTSAHGGVDLLVNNAGVAVGGNFEEIDEVDFERLFGVNFWGVVRMTRAFLPLLRKSDDASIANISSVFGLIAPPGQTAYAASKFAIRGFSESLRHELAGTRVAVTIVHPGGVATSIVKHSRLPKSLSAEEAAERRKSFESLLTMPAEVAGEIIVRGIERRKARLLVGADAKRIALIERLMPVHYWAMLGRRSKK